MERTNKPLTVLEATLAVAVLGAQLYLLVDMATGGQLELELQKVWRGSWAERHWSAVCRRFQLEGDVARGTGHVIFAAMEILDEEATTDG